MLKQKISIAAALLISCFSFACLETPAQHANSGGQGEAFWQLLKQPITLPDIPQYSGQAQFISGLMYPNKPGGPTVSMTYRAREAPDTVLSWYEEALKAYRWSGRKAPPNKGRVFEASKGGSSITVTVTDSTVRGFLSDFKLSCKVAR